ncbi:hypothetical protein P170DRAFT_248673 [Aspergillus steynii IBT 23096]|uniref:Uncharacterized protein n=1 Tax=Aspergillus steynii IBT 23096 TaxID=1392250 RepID=A0A2I2FYE8_9EURO|nr:uncharacterized protein P170DRAFT_248673 [Aspergillus steynii IBT 23096]PLB45660.1 hypothetical protein P170DRAFT_248673 [Aspergillus steynii IBT 23096]
MPSPQPKRIVLEKSRTVRRRYQRSNKRLEFSASQIARIERDEEREKRAKKLREREKKRIANKKKKAEKEAKEREERRRQGLPPGVDQHALPVPSSQPLLSRFLRRKDAEVEKEVPEQTELVGEEDAEGDLEGELELGSLGSLEEESFLSDLDELSDDTIIAGLENGLLQEGQGQGSTKASRGVGAAAPREKDDDEFSDCSIFYDEDIIKEADSIITARDSKEPQPEKSDTRAPIGLPVGDSFQDDTADLLEEFGYEFDTDEEFERELVQLDVV